MTDEHLEPIEPEIAALLERERLGYPDDARAKAALLSRVELAVGLAAPGGRGAGGGDLSSPRWPAGAVRRAIVSVGLGAFVAGGVVGAGVARLVTRVDAGPLAAPPASAGVTVDAASRPDEDGAPPPVATGSTASTAGPEPLPSSAEPSPTHLDASSPRSADDGRGDLTRERELLDAARAALTHGRPDEAIAAAERHARQWPRGYLVEEREAVWIQALAASGRRAEASGRAARFRRAFPGSVLRPAVDAAVGAGDAGP